MRINQTFSGWGEKQRERGRKGRGKSDVAHRKVYQTKTRETGKKTLQRERVAQCSLRRPLRQGKKAGEDELRENLLLSRGVTHV